ncbi:MAG: WD40 repeat domain-containing protein [Anaerolineae bacterium]
MHGNKRHIARAALLLSGLLFTLNLSLAQDSVEPAPLVPITSQNVSELTRWVPLDQNGQQAQEWIPVARGALLDIDQSPNDALIAVGSSTGVYLFDTSHLQQAPQHIAELYETTRGIFSPDGTKIVLQTETQQLYVYNVGSGTVVDLAAAADSVRLGGLQFSPDSGSVFAASYDNENHYHIVEWNADTGAQRARFELPEISAYVSASRPYQVFIPFTVTEDRLITWHPLAVSVSNATTVVQTWNRDSHAEQQRFDLPVDVSWVFLVASAPTTFSSKQCYTQ